MFIKITPMYSRDPEKKRWLTANVKVTINSKFIQHVRFVPSLKITLIKLTKEAHEVPFSDVNDRLVVTESYAEVNRMLGIIDPLDETE